MKTLLVILGWLLATGSLWAQEVARTWTDTQGRTLSAVFVEANKQEVIVRSADGKLVNLPRKQLSGDDLSYADKAQAAKPLSLTIGGGRAMFNSKTTETVNESIKVENWGYNFTITNTTLLTGQNLRAECQLFYRRTKGTTSGDLNTQPITSQPNTVNITTVEPAGTFTFRTDPLAITTTELKSNAYFTSTGTNTVVNAKIEGAWLRVYQNDMLIAEYVSSDDIRKLGWPVDTPGRRGNVRTGGAAGAGGAAP